MAHLLVRHMVQDFAKWKLVYDAHHSAREVAGLKDVFVWRNTDQPNEVVVLLEIVDISKAKAFTMSPELKEKMIAAGAVGPPEVIFLSGDEER